MQILVLAKSVLRAFVWRPALGCALFLAACQQGMEPEPPATIARLNFANGSSISDGQYDDYQPIIVQLANGTLALVFISNRPCTALCSGDSIFFSSSVSPYIPGGKLPAFKPLSNIVGNTNAIGVTRPARIAVGVSGNQINIYWRDGAGGAVISESVLFSPTGGVDMNIGLGPYTIGASGTGCTTSNILGLDATGNMIAVASTNAISRFNTATYAGNCNTTNMFANTGLASAQGLSVLRSASIGIADGFLVTEAGGKLSAQTATTKGPQIKSFTDSLAAQGLTLTSASILNASQPSGDLLVFSASTGTGKPSDLYVLTNKSPAELWLKYVRYGNQPTP